MNDTVNPVEGEVTGTDATTVASTQENLGGADPTNTPVENPSEDGGKVVGADNNKSTEQADPAKDGDVQNSEIDIEKLKFAEGFTTTDEQRAEIKEDLDALGITTQEGAQKFIDWIIDKSKGVTEGLAKQQENEIGDLEKSWIEDGKRDPVLGKDYDTNVSEALNLASQIFSPRTMDFLKDTKFEKNPDFLKDMLRLAKERADAELISGKNSRPSFTPKRDSQGNPMLNFK